MGKEIHTLRGHKHQVTALVYSPDGQTLTSRSSDQTVRFWEVSTGKELRQWRVGYVDARRSSMMISERGLPLVSASFRFW
jgi:WD40 repeat protein